MARRLGAALVGVGLIAGVAACGDDDDDDGGGDGGGGSTVVVTTNILGDIVANVVGDQATVEVLMPPNADPHSFGISAAQAARMTEADLVVTNGLGLEEAIASNIEAARDAGVAVLDIGPEVDPISFAEETGDDAGTLDPHIWTDPGRMVLAVEIIADEVAENVDGAVPGSLEANVAAYTAELEELTVEIEQKVATLAPEQRRLITNHHVLGYFADRFGFDVIGAVLPSGTTLASPSAADLAGLATTIEDAGVTAIFADSSQPDRLAQVLADEVGLDVEIVELYSESLGDDDSGAATYVEMMTTNTTRIVDALSR